MQDTIGGMGQMGTSGTRWATPGRRWCAIAGAALTAGALVLGCTPPPTGSTPTTTVVADPMPPIVHSFVVKGVQAAPAVITLGWHVSDPNLDPLTCRIDGDGDGVVDLTIERCGGTGSRNVTIDVPGQVTASIEVTDGNSAPVTATRTYTVPTGIDEPLDIELRGLDALDPAVASAFTAAVARWERTIVRGLPDYAPPPRPSCLPASVPDLPAFVDDIIVDVSTPNIDGVGNILGRAGPTCVLLSTELGFHGIMEFDAADVAAMLADGTLADVVAHELGHVLGFGTLWDMSWATGGVRRLLDGRGGADPRFNGVRAVAEHSRYGGTGNVPVESGGGAGTRDSHWRELTFDNELMTGFIDRATNPLSRLSIASMADLGYRVDLSQADPYTPPGGAALRQSPLAEVEGEMVRPPVGLG